MNNYLFVLGNASELAEEELCSVFPGRELNGDTFNLLGGTIKVAEIFEGSIVEKLIEGKKPGERITFGVNGEVDLGKIKEAKRELEAKGFKARFVLPQRGDNELSSVVVKKQDVAEVYSFADLQAKTVWVQDFEDWGKRDYGRPEAQGHVGMLPPKVARMMVNIAKAENILDPFCGVGTILAEALTVGIKVIGADIDPRQVERTKKNLAWLGYQCPLFVADARGISTRILAHSVDAIVTEPDLGPNKPMTPDSRFKIYGKLEQLYLASLEEWKKVLKAGGRVVIVIPSSTGDQILVKTLVDKAKVMGYSLLSGPFPYFRPQAEVRRNICVFTYGTH